MWTKRKMINKFKANTRLFLHFSKDDLDMLKSIAILDNMTVQDKLKQALREIVKHYKIRSS